MAIEDLAVGGWPAMVFDPRPEATRTRYYPDGVAASDTSREVPLQVSAIDLQDVFEEIDRAHVKQLGSPMTRRKLWEDASKHWPRQDAENRIQEALEMWLQGRYLTCDVRAEQPGASGRLDLEIYVPIGAPNGPKTPGALLELKVLRSYGEKGGRYTEEYTREWIKSGVVQAASYRDDRSFPEAALCCFDMRVELEGVACFAHVADEAERVRSRYACGPFLPPRPHTVSGATQKSIRDHVEVTAGVETSSAVDEIALVLGRSNAWFEQTASREALVSRCATSGERRRLEPAPRHEPPCATAPRTSRPATWSSSSMASRRSARATSACS